MKRSTEERMLESLKKHWPEYLMEAAHLGMFMMAACLAALVLDHPSSPVPQLIPDPVLRRVLTGMAMGLTAMSIVYSPWGKQSGAHFNPALTLTFLRLKKISPNDAVFYIAAQFVGGIAGVLLVRATVGSPLGHPSVNYVATLPGAPGQAVAFVAEVLISFLLMTVVLTVSNHKRLARFTGVFAGTLVATFISLEAPFSGMSMNPARTFGSAFAGHLWTGLWIYFTAPLAGMLLAAETYLRRKGAAGVFCAKLHHQNDKRCIFCEYQHSQKPPVAVEAAAS
ncbi:MAG: aquaporin [Acidobacteriota bacterium]